MDSNKLSDALVHLGRNSGISKGSVNLPVFQSSTILFDTLADFEYARDHRYECGTLYYGRYGHPASFELEKMMAELEGGDSAITVSSGLAAITISLMAVAKAGTHVLVADNVYSPTRAFCDNVLVRYGVEVSYFDSMIGKDISTLFKENTAAVMYEAPVSGTFEVPDIPAISAATRAHGALSILDATWATPVFCQPLQLGVDVVVHSGSKYIGGHADLMIGFIVCQSHLYEPLRKMALAFGEKAGATDVSLALRGLRTLEMRMQHHYSHGLIVATWLAEQPIVKKVLHPALTSCPGHENWKRDFSGAGGLFSVIFDTPDTNKVRAFVDSLKLFSIGLSWGGFESLVLPVNPKASRTASNWETTGSLVRFNIGNENTDSLIDDLKQALQNLE